MRRPRLSEFRQVLLVGRAGPGGACRFAPPQLLTVGAISRTGKRHAIVRPCSERQVGPRLRYVACRGSLRQFFVADCRSTFANSRRWKERFAI